MEAVALVPVLFLVIGIVFAVVGIRNYKSGAAFEQRAVRAAATVTEVRTHLMGTRSDRDPVDFPVVRFTLPDGRVVEAETMYGSRPLPVKPGQDVTVLHDPDDPTRVMLPGVLGSGRFLWGMFIALGVGFAAMGAVGTAIVILVLIAA